jgi:hypothetical protein
MRQTFLFIIFLIIASCSIKNSDDNKTYYIINPIEYSYDHNIPPPPPKMFYGRNNFILLNNGKIYYHKKFGYNDKLVYPDDFNKQPFLNLEFSDFKLIELKNLRSFLASEITDTSRNGFNESTAIKSQTDTIRHPAFPIIFNYLKEKGFRRYTIIQCTEEEAMILNDK